ncbi:hypothetical protein HPB51_005778 [Rhipicephalus microplus]|uniref:CCHC-type domain-containing protein n=1 Tax=Rhipicephalus microplus TaxID=6941 RepID=A0A9J6ENA4_RHIMP|nr:hypothetical protein HPB51_005778 [Rhipicephalus microplus]
MATPNQVTGYDPESLQIMQMDTAQTETPLPTEEEYLKDMLRVWHGRKNAAVASRDAKAPAAKQQAASRPQQAQGKNAPSVASQHAKQLYRSILGADASVGFAVWPLWDQNVLACTLKSVDAAKILLRDIRLPVGGHQLTFRGHPKLSGEFCRGVVHVSQDETSETVKSKLSAEPNVVSVHKLEDTPVAVITFAWTKVPRTVLYNCERFPVRLYKKTVPACPLCGTVGHRADTCPRPQPGRCTSCDVQVPAATPDGPTEHQCIPSCLLCGGGHNTGAPDCAGRFRQPVSRDPHVDPSRGQRGGGHKQAPTPKTGPKKAPAAKSNKPEPNKTNTGHSTNVKSGTPSEPPVLVKDFPPLTPVQAQELEAKQVGSSEQVQEDEAEDGDDGSSVTSRLTSVSRQDADTVVGPASITGSIGRIESLEHKTEQLEASVAALPTPIMSAVRESFQDMFTAALTQALPEIVAQVSNSVLKAVQPWVIALIKNTTQSDSPQVKRKPASRPSAPEPGLITEQCGGPVLARGSQWQGPSRIVPNNSEDKILAYVVPALIHAWSQHVMWSGDGPIVLVITTTRELARKAKQMFSRYDKESGIRTACLVSEEVDSMLATGLEQQLRLIVATVRPDRQMLTWLTSRTNEASQLAVEFIEDYVTVRVGETSQEF